MSWTWQGRQLTTAEKDGTTLNYTYDSDGIRTSKTVGTVKTSYLLNGTQILAQTTNGKTFCFFYDQQGNRVAMADGSNHFYYYIYNLQGDVIALADASTGKLVVTYTYDSWGKLMELKDTTANSVGTLNPFRYRGYYYDHETGLYYLNSRYYDADTGRFISEDAIVITNMVGPPIANIFSYCDNNPVNRADSLGLCWFDAKGNWCHDNWEYLYGYERKPKPEVIDLTEPLNDYMHKNADELEAYEDEKGFLPAAIYFYNNVKDGGKLDIKLSDEWKFETGKIYVYNGRELRYDDPGNINFGFVGAVIFPLDVLCFGAGTNQVKNYGFRFGDFSTFFDDPRDNEMIKYGYTLYFNSRQCS